MRCFVLITLVQGLSGQPIDAKKSYLNRDLAFLVIPVEPTRDAPNARARAAITTTRGVFYVKETADEIISAKCATNSKPEDSKTEARPKADTPD